jgi:hypothetical protein
MDRELSTLLAFGFHQVPDECCRNASLSVERMNRIPSQLGPVQFTVQVVDLQPFRFESSISRKLRPKSTELAGVGPAVNLKLIRRHSSQSVPVERVLRHRLAASNDA